MNEIREGDLDRQDGHDPKGSEYCATGLCEHERGPGLAVTSPPGSPEFVIEAFFASSSRLHASLTARDDDPEGQS